jgi:hypothetical protein
MVSVRAWSPETKVLFQSYVKPSPDLALAMSMVQ